MLILYICKFSLKLYKQFGQVLFCEMTEESKWEKESSKCEGKVFKNSVKFGFNFLTDQILITSLFKSCA